MRSVYMVAHQSKPDLRQVVGRVSEALCRHGIRVSAEEWLWDAMGDSACTLFNGQSLEGCEAIVALGGDGTLLRANALSVQHHIPLLGVNIGTVGFLTEVELEGLERACDKLQRDQYRVEKRMMLQSELGGQTTLALNDVVVSRGGYARLIGVNAWAGEEQLGRFIGDGLIVSTATGSTGYSLSAGGPIICPEVDCVLITPICAHSLQHRPVVASPDRRITIRLDDRHAPKALVSVDGQVNLELKHGDELVISRAENPACFIRLEDQDFFSKIRYKLSEWSC